jgi:hypothetical protein
VGSPFEYRAVSGDDGCRVVGEQARGPQLVAQVMAGGLQPGGEATVENDRA